MTNNSNISDVKNLLWMDLEMTNIADPAQDRIIEVAVVATHFDFVELGRYESGVRQDEQEMRTLMALSDFKMARPVESEAEIQTSLNGRDERQVEDEILDFVERYFNDEQVYLAGNSIFIDRSFIRHWWPRLHARLHYRMLDVTSYKLVWLARGSEPFVKQEKHTALADIEESIAELKHYLQKIKL